MKKELMRRGEVLRRLGIGRRTLEYVVECGHLSTVQLVPGGQRYYWVEEVENYLSELRRKSAPNT